MTTREQSKFEVEIGKEYHIEPSSVVEKLEREDGKLMLTLAHDPVRSYDRTMRVVKEVTDRRDGWIAVAWPEIDGERFIVEQRPRPRFDRYVTLFLNQSDMRDLVMQRESMLLAEALVAIRRTIREDLTQRYPKGLPPGCRLELRATVLKEGEVL